MGEFASLYIAGYEVESWKNSIGEGSYLFSEDDYVQTTRVYNGEEKDDGEEGENSKDYQEPSDVTQEGHQYESTASNIIDRLEIMGFTLKRSKEQFEEGIAYEIERAKEYSTMTLPEAEENILFPVMSPFHPEAVKYLENYTFDLWSELIAKVIDENLALISFSNQTEIQQRDPYLYHILEWHNGHSFGFPRYGGMHMYRAMLEVVSPNTPVILDFSNLVGWVGLEDYLCSPPKTVIMTEGTSDKRILDETLRILYPHLHPYFSFIDFALANMPGSTGHLLNIVKAFVATGVERRTVAVFDNDTAGHDALRQLSVIPLPDNIKAIALPHLPLATHYPSIGPQGRTETDINGHACSLELYLGRDILKDASGELTPIQWGGLMQGVRRYQGEITNKTVIQEKYFRLLADAAIIPEIMQSHDWSGMQLIFKVIFDLFKDQPVFEYA
jgi:hypothetical protein